MMYIDNEVLEKMIMTIVEGFDRIEKKLDRMNRVKDCLDGDTLLDNYDVARLLGVTLRTCIVFLNLLLYSAADFSYIVAIFDL